MTLYLGRSSSGKTAYATSLADTLNATIFSDRIDYPRAHLSSATIKYFTHLPQCSIVIDDIFITSETIEAINEVMNTHDVHFFHTDYIPALTNVRRIITLDKRCEKMIDMLKKSYVENIEVQNLC